MNHTNLNQEESLETDESVMKKSAIGSQLKPNNDDSIESIGWNLM